MPGRMLFGHEPTQDQTSQEGGAGTKARRSAERKLSRQRSSGAQRTWPRRARSRHLGGNGPRASTEERPPLARNRRRRRWRGLATLRLGEVRHALQLVLAERRGDDQRITISAVLQIAPFDGDGFGTDAQEPADR